MDYERSTSDFRNTQPFVDDYMYANNADILSHLWATSNLTLSLVEPPTTFSVVLKPSSSSNGSENDSTESELFLSYTRLVCSMILAPILTLVGVILNVINILVLRKMHSSTNFYLMCLASFDLSYLLFSLIMRIDMLPPDSSQWFQHYYGWGQFLTDFCSNMSVMLVVAFTIERCVVVIWPIRGKALCTTAKAKRAIVCIAIGVFLLTVPTILEFEVVTTKNPDTGELVYMAQPTRLGDSFQKFYYWATSITFIFLPLCIVIVLNTFLIRSIQRSTLIRKSMAEGQHLDRQRAQQQSATEQRITLLLIAVVLVFIILQTPTAIMMLVWALASAEYVKRHSSLLRGLGNIFNLFMTLNACANFFLYAGLSQRFRAMFLRMFCARCYDQSPTGGRGGGAGTGAATAANSATHLLRPLQHSGSSPSQLNLHLQNKAQCRGNNSSSEQGSYRSTASTTANMPQMMSLTFSNGKTVMVGRSSSPVEPKSSSSVLIGGSCGAPLLLRRDSDEPVQYVCSL